MSAADRYLSEAALRAKYGDAEYEKRRAIGAFGVAVPQENYSMPAAPSGFVDSAAARDAMQLAQELQDAQQPQNPGRRVQVSRKIGPEGEISYAKLYPGRAGSYRGLDIQAQRRAEEREFARQAFLEAGRSDWTLPQEGLEAAFGPGATRPNSPQEALQRILGREVGIDAAKRAQQYAEILGIGPRAAYQLALADAGQASVPESLLRKIASTGEIAPDPVASALASGLNRQALVQRPVYADELGAWANTDETVPVLSDSGLQAVAESLDRAITGQPGTPFRQLTAEETAAAAEAAGVGKTQGGRRNSLRKNTDFPEEAAVVRRPGSVLSQGIEPNPANFLMPVLVAPKNQQVWTEGAADLRGDDRVMQVAQYNAGKNEQGRTSWRPALRDARVLYINPYAEVPGAVLERVGLDMVPYLPEKDQSGAMDQKALNVPIPDITGEGGFRSPSDDPGYGMRGETRYRNPTIAEAVQSLLLRHSTPIKAYTEDMLVRRGAGYEDAIRMPDGTEVPVYALGSKRDAGGRPLPISAYFQEPSDPAAPKVADVRVGTANRYTPEFYAAFDDLIGELAAQAYGRNAPIPAELAGRERFQPVRGQIPAEKLRYGALMNLAGNADIDAAAAYQRSLLQEAGFPVSGRARNPLMEMVAVLKDLGAAPPADAPVRNAALTAAQAEPIVAPSGLTGVARLLQQAKQEKLSTMAAQDPTTSRARQTDENAAYSLLGRLIGGAAVPQPRQEAGPRYGVYRDDLSIGQPRYRQAVIPGIEQELRFPQATAADDPLSRLTRMMAVRANIENTGQPEMEPRRVEQYVPRELMADALAARTPFGPQPQVMLPESSAPLGYLAKLQEVGRYTRPAANDQYAPRVQVSPQSDNQSRSEMQLGGRQGELPLGRISGEQAASYVDDVARYMRRFPPETAQTGNAATERAVQLELLRRARSGGFGRVAEMRIGR